MICTKIDEWLVNQDKTMWVATLSSGTVVYQDDGRPGTKMLAWQRLAAFLRDNSSLKIVKLELKFRSHVERVGINELGWFFCHGHFGSMDGTVSIKRHVAGFVRDDTVYTRAWQVPELLPMESQERHISMVDPKTIIMNGEEG
jgi:hypothetical protein